MAASGSSADLLISPAVYSSVTGTNVSLWRFAVHGNIVLSNAGEYTVTCYKNFTKSVRVWGSGGSPATSGIEGWGVGGAGGSATGNVSFLANTTYKIRVSSAGANGAAPATCYGGGAGGGVFSVGTAGSGGGYSGIFINSVSQIYTVILAGGGGGGASSRYDARGGRRGGGGGGTTGEPAGSADVWRANPGTQTAGGTPNTGSVGGNNGFALGGGAGASGGGGGGGGYFGGGGGGYQTQNDGGIGGGGGSGYLNTTYVSSGTLYIANASSTVSGQPAANNTDPYYASGVAYGAATGGTSGNGRIVIVA